MTEYNIEGIYLLKTDIVLDDNIVYKVGRSIHVIDRIKSGYSKKYEIEHIVYCNNSIPIETKIIREFNIYFKLFKGREFFIGNKKEMIIIINTIIKEYNEQNTNIINNITNNIKIINNKKRYKCDDCIYETDRKDNFIKHKKTDKHLINEKNKISEKQNILKKSDISINTEIDSVVIDEYNELINQVIEINKEIHELQADIFINSYTHVLNQADHIDKLHVEELEKNNASWEKKLMKAELESAGKLANKDAKIIETMNKDKNEFAKSNHDVLKILNTLCQATGALEPMTDADCRLYLGNDDEDNAVSIMNHYQFDTLPVYLTEMLEKKYSVALSVAKRFQKGESTFAEDMEH